MMKNTILVGLLVGVTAITVVSLNIAISGEEKNIDLDPFEPLTIDTKQNSHLIEDSFPGHTRNWSIKEDPWILISSEPLQFPDGFVLRAPNGEPGEDRTGTGRIIGGDGQPGKDILIDAPFVTFEGKALLQAGDGGRGGFAWSTGQPDAWAQGGAGGPGGQVIIKGEIIGAPTIIHGDGGLGGDARAEGSSGCDRESGSDEVVMGEDGGIGENGESATAEGTDGTCGVPTGGHGGNATAQGGNGGPSPMGQGGHGGNATAVAGKGGDGTDYCTNDLEQVHAWIAEGILRAGDGGMGGEANATGGHGGAGLDGGNGGNAESFTESGRGGHGTTYTGGRFLWWTWDEGPSIQAGNGTVNNYYAVAGGDGGIGTLGNGGGGGWGHGTAQAGGGGNACLIHSHVDGTWNILRTGGIFLIPVLLVAGAGFTWFAIRKRSRN